MNHTFLLRIGLTVEMRLDLMRHDFFADPLGLSNEILDFNETSREYHFAPLHSIHHIIRAVRFMLLISFFF